jgi:hypothetical protein
MGDARRLHQHLRGWCLRWLIVVAIFVIFLALPSIIMRSQLWMGLPPSGQFLVAGTILEAIGLDLLRLIRKHELGGAWLFRSLALIVTGALSLLRAFGFI